MTVSASTATATPAATDSGALGKARLAENFNTFLSLLTTQLKNQDPLSPLDSNQFTQQLVQMTGVEQQIYSNDLLKQLVGNSSGGVTSAVSLIGKVVTATSNNATLTDGEANWSYAQPRTASDVKIEVLDANGRLVHVEAASDTKAGSHDFSWDGKDLNGRTLDDGGTYTLRITALDSSGTAVPVTTSVTGLATAVEQVSGKTLITIGGTRVGSDKITAVSQASPPPSAPVA